MISAYQSILEYKGDDIQDHIESIGLEEVFKPLFSPFPDTEGFPDVLRNHQITIIKYILRAYSIESDMIVLGSDWHKTKKKIFEAVWAKPEKGLYESLVLLKSETVVMLIGRWMGFCDDDSFTSIQMLKDLQVEMRITSVSNIRKASMEIDYDQKFKNAQYALDLKKMIKDLESELIQNSAKLKDAIMEYKEYKKSASFGMETFLKENNV